MVFYGVYEHNLAICAIISALPEFSSITNEKILLTLVENPGTIYFILLWGKVTMSNNDVTFDFNFSIEFQKNIVILGNWNMSNQKHSTKFAKWITYYLDLKKTF